ncbi:MbtH family protein [Streptomyces sp. CAU 1734]|uniref:MbtH family protein n=1 Tax=Streptomyces sp. CAU 1734 TaxID=3140360 RepID=UPI0032606D24
MTTNPFDDDSGTFHALVNDEGQYSLWPAFLDVPRGWSVAHGPDTRVSCVEHIEREWTDMRPKSLVAQMTADAESRTRL